MKKCPYCAEDIQDAAVVCKHCGRDLAGGASQVQIVTPPKKTSPAAWGCLTLIVLFAVFAMIGQCGTPSSPSRTTSTPSTPAAPPSPPADQLALLSSTGGHSSESFMKVEGQVKNISDAPLKSVAAVVTWYDKDDQFIAADTTLIEYDPLLPGQTSPFHVLMRANPMMKMYSIAFKHLIGGEIPTIDRRKK